MAKIIPKRRHTKAPANLLTDPDFQARRETTRASLVVGVGASAGGLDSFKLFFENMPSDTGMSFVLIQHLDPTYPSSLVSIVSEFTQMPVLLAEQGGMINPDHIYVIGPGSILTIKDGRFQLDSAASTAARRNSVNSFLISLAEDQRENAVGIILSGFGSDGALGIAAIKERGGMTLSEAEFDHHAKSGMPQSAASGGFVDQVIEVRKMAAALQEYQQNRLINDSINWPDGIRQDITNHLNSICAILLGKLGHDFSKYKTGTLMRRIRRRMHASQAKSITA